MTNAELFSAYYTLAMMHAGRLEISGYKLQYIDHVYFMGIILPFPQGNLTHTSFPVRF